MLIVPLLADRVEVQVFAHFQQRLTVHTNCRSIHTFVVPKQGAERVVHPSDLFLEIDLFERMAAGNELGRCVPMSKSRVVLAQLMQSSEVGDGLGSSTEIVDRLAAIGSVAVLCHDREDVYEVVSGLRIVSMLCGFSFLRTVIVDVRRLCRSCRRIPLPRWRDRGSRPKYIDVLGRPAIQSL